MTVSSVGSFVITGDPGAGVDTGVGAGVEAGVAAGVGVGVGIGVAAGCCVVVVVFVSDETTRDESLCDAAAFSAEEYVNVEGSLPM